MVSLTFLFASEFIAIIERGLTCSYYNLLLSLPSLTTTLEAYFDPDTQSLFNKTSPMAAAGLKNPPLLEGILIYL